MQPLSLFDTIPDWYINVAIVIRPSIPLVVPEEIAAIISSSRFLFCKMIRILGIVALLIFVAGWTEGAHIINFVD